MPNFSVTVATPNGKTSIIAQTSYFADAVLIASRFSNSYVMDFQTGQILRVYTNGELVYTV